MDYPRRGGEGPNHGILQILHAIEFERRYMFSKLSTYDLSRHTRLLAFAVSRHLDCSQRPSRTVQTVDAGFGQGRLYQTSGWVKGKSGGAGVLSRPA